MDPLSITASIITIIGVGGQAAKAVRKLASLKGAPDLVLALNNEISDLHLVVLAIQDVFQRQQTSGLLFPGSWPGEANVNASVTKSLRDANEKVVELEALHNRLITSASGPSGSATLNRTAWLREQKRVKKMQEDLRSVRLKLTAALSILNSSTLLRVQEGVQVIQNNTAGLQTLQHQSEIIQRQRAFDHQNSIQVIHDKIKEVQTFQQQSETVQDQRAVDQESSVQTIQDKIRDLQNTQQRISSAQTQKLAENEAAVQKPIAQVLNFQQRLELKMDIIEAKHVANNAESRIRTNAQSVLNPRRTMGYSLASSTVQITTSVTRCTCNDTSIKTIIDLWIGTQSSNTPRLDGDVEGLKEIIKRGFGSPLDLDVSNGYTALSYAVTYGQIEACQLLLHAGADPHIEDFSSQTPTDFAWRLILSNRGDASTLESLRALFPGQGLLENSNLSLLHRTVLGLTLINLGTLLDSLSKLAINESDAHGRTALWWATSRGDALTISLLLKYGADANKLTLASSSPLHAAIFVKNHTCINMLLNTGCIVDYMDAQGWLPLHHSCYYGSSVDIMKALLGDGIYINSQVRYTESTPLMLAAQENHIHIMKHLISRGANMNAANVDGECSLHVAISRNRLEVLRLLLQLKANHLLRTKAGESLLHYAAQFGSIECLEILCMFSLEGIDPEERITGTSPTQTSPKVKGLTALEIAEQRTYVTTEWLTMFRKLVHGIRFQESKSPELPITETEMFQDALESQD
ncbi:MAG: hypothetical protein Q9187_006741 [Circinaria calcarea]